MNLLPIILVLTLILTPPVLSSTDRSEVIVKEGHRVVMVEYDKEAVGVTKVSISPLNGNTAEPTCSGPRELVCDAYGKCKHIVAKAVEKTKDMVMKTAHGVTDKAQEIEQHAKDEVEKRSQDFGEVVEKTKDMVKKTAHGVTNKAHEIEQHAKDAMNEAVEKRSQDFGEVVEKTKDMVKKTAHGVTNKAHEIEQHAKDAMNEAVEKRSQDFGEVVEKTKDMVKNGFTNKVHDAKDEAVEKRPQDLGEKVSEKVNEGIGKAKKLAGDVKAVVKDGTSNSPKRIVEDTKRSMSGLVKDSVKNVGKIRLSDVLSSLRDVIWYRDKSKGWMFGLVHMMGFSTAYGMCVWVTFVSSYVLGRYLPRQMFGMVQSRIYPVYFKAMAYCISAALLGHLGSLKTEDLRSKTGMFQSLCLVSALLMVFTNLISLEPKATKAMYERMKIEKEEGRGVGVAVAAKDRTVDGGGPATVVASVVVGQDVLRLNEKLKRLNAYSSTLNLFTLVALTWHMAYMGQQLQATRT